jgi:hypothetical protein
VETEKTTAFVLAGHVTASWRPAEKVQNLNLFGDRKSGTELEPLSKTGPN